MKEEKEIGAKATIKEEVIKKRTLDELLAEDKELQSQYDAKVTKSIKTAKIKWAEERKSKKKNNKKIQQQLEKEKSEKYKALVELNAYKLKEETIKLENCSRTINKILEEICK
ncbi:MAG: hypothetical protein HFJ44_04695 [Clostridia bacterium]|nr:hypothetical protein [Clostridia bacterium]